MQHFTLQGVKKVSYQVDTYLEKLAKTDEFEKVFQQFPKETETDSFKKVWHCVPIHGDFNHIGQHLQKLAKTDGFYQISAQNFR